MRIFVKCLKDVKRLNNRFILSFKWTSYIAYKIGTNNHTSN